MDTQSVILFSYEKSYRKLFRRCHKKDIADLRSDNTTLRSDYKRTERYLRSEMLKLEGRIENIEDSSKRIEGKLDKLGNTLDRFVKRVDDLTTENTVGTDQIHNLRKTAVAHDTRIKKFESATFPTH